MRKAAGLCFIGLAVAWFAQAEPFQKPDMFSALQVRAHLPAWTNPVIDERGNLIVTFGTGSEHLFFVGHLDEVGYVIKEINSDGTLSVDRPDDLYDQYLEARPVLIYTRGGAVSGVITPRLDRVYLETDTKEETEDLGIKTGDSITVPKRFMQPFSDRTGSTAMLLALMKLDPDTVNKRITFAWTVEEEVGLNNVRVLAEKLKADYVFTVDTIVAEAPAAKGFVIRAIGTKGSSPLLMVNRVIEIARRHNVAMQPTVNNAATNITLSRASRYSHSPIEVLDRWDLDALTDVLRHLVLEF